MVSFVMHDPPVVLQCSTVVLRTLARLGLQFRNLDNSWFALATFDNGARRIFRGLLEDLDQSFVKIGIS